MLIHSNKGKLKLNDPKVSIFICTYNQEEYIAETIESFLMQKTDFLFEIIIADDHSTDMTLKICENYALKNSIIKIIGRQKNLGLIENFFSGIKKCRGKYIAMCGGDDYWTDCSKLQKQISYLDENPQCVITYTDSIMINEQSVKVSETEVGIENLRDFSKEELQKGAFISARTMCFRNIIEFNKIKYRGIQQEDAFLISLLGEFGYGKFISDIKPSVYRILSRGIWSSQSEIEKLKSSMITFWILRKYYKNKKNISLKLFYERKYFKNNDRKLHLSVKTKLTKEVLHSYFISIFKPFKLNEFLLLNKTIIKYFINL